MRTKKLISLILTIVMLMAVAVPAFSAGAAESYPIIYIEGYGDAIYKDKNNPSEENRVFAPAVDFEQLLSEKLQPVLTELAKGLVTGDYDKYCDELYDVVAPIFKDMALDKNGEASDGSGIILTSYTTPQSNGVYDRYRFVYDWRLSPIAVAADLKDYVDYVKEATGKDKVNLVGRCLGGNIISAYLTCYEDHAAENVKSVILYIPSTMGFDLTGSIFSGTFIFDADSFDNFFEHFLNNKGKDLITDPLIKAFVTSMLTFFNQIQMLDIGLDLFKLAVDNIKDDLAPRLIRDTFGSFPSFWAMVDVDSYEAARDYAFSGLEEEYAGLIAKCDDYYNNVQLKFYDTIDRLEDKGVTTNVIAKYNLPAIPLYENSNETSDMISGTKDISLGATCADYNKVLSDDYINSLEDKRFVSPDRKIDASTCVVPERTWFVKDLIHDNFPGCVDELILEILNANGEMTVFNNETYPQYLLFDIETETLSPVTGMDEEVPASGSVKAILTSIINFIKNLFRLFAKLLGNINLGGKAE